MRIGPLNSRKLLDLLLELKADVAALKQAIEEVKNPAPKPKKETK